MVPDLMRRIYGSDDLFPDSRADAYHAYQSVNYITPTTASRSTISSPMTTSTTGQTEIITGWYGRQLQLELWARRSGSVFRISGRALRRKQVKNFCCLLCFRMAHRCFAPATNS